MRGKQYRTGDVIRHRGNIPAYAGKTGRMAWKKFANKEHPRVCGENTWVIRKACTRHGTSPRMRGKPVLGVALASNMKEHPRVCGENDRVRHGHVHPRGTSPRMRGKHATTFWLKDPTRNIPAYAGKTSFTTSLEYTLAEHPRVCGENRGGAYRSERY